MKKISYIIFMVLLGSVSSVLTSCGDFLDQESDRVIYSDKERLDNASDTLYSVIGIMNKMQALADRTVLLGELRGDLVDVCDNTSADLREISNFSVSSDNQYNSPRDYYAVINNCNYFLAKADTALKNNRNEYVFQKEYAAVKAYRAWTYLQLVLNYGKVPLVTDPILTKDDADKQYDMYDIKGICNYFVNDIAAYQDVEMPGYGTIRNNDSRLFYIPIKVLMGDLNLWAGNYKEAAKCYYNFINTRNGSNSSFPIGNYTSAWSKSDTKWQMSTDSWSYHCFEQETYTSTSEILTVIPGDSIPSEGNYSELKNLFNSNSDNSYKASIIASQNLTNLSKSQKYCHINTANEVTYAPDNLSGSKAGDLRLGSCYTELANSAIILNGQSIGTYVSNTKYTTRNVRIYRLTMVYLRLAEALNRAGYPRFAFAILQKGINNNVIESDVLPYYPEDEAYLSQFDFSTNLYKTRTRANGSDENTIGIHSRGCGWTEYNEYYTYPEAESVDAEMEAVENMIVDEEALEFAFEGLRYYDLMRVALRRNDPAYLANKIYARRGADKTAEMKSLIGVDLTNTSNWYLNWNGKLGLSDK